MDVKGSIYDRHRTVLLLQMALIYQSPHLQVKDNANIFRHALPPPSHVLNKKIVCIITDRSAAGLHYQG